MKCALSALLLCSGLYAQLASIEGATVNSITGEAIPGVRRNQWPRRPLLHRSYPAATYLARPERSRFLPANPPGKTIATLTVRPGGVG